MDNQPGPEISLDSVEDWIVKYRAALAQDLKRSQPRAKRFLSAIEDLVRTLLHHFHFNSLAARHFVPPKPPQSESREDRRAPDLARLG